MRAKTILILMAGATALVACGARTTKPADVDPQTLRAVGDRFDRAQIEQDRAALERLVADDLVFVGSNGVREGKAEFIAGFVDPNVTFEPISIVDPVIVPLGPDAGIVGGDVVLRGTANGEPFASRIRFADTFRRIDGEWKAVHIQATRVPEPTP
jgi:ketosteroid isomerase-like protein